MPSDKYLNNPDHVKEMEDMGCEVDPVDLNGHFVPVKKFDSENLKETEESISEDFSL